MISPEHPPAAHVHQHEGPPRPVTVGWRVLAETNPGRWSAISGPWPFPTSGKARHEYEIVKRHGYRGSYGRSHIKCVPEGVKCRLVFDGEIASTIYEEWTHAGPTVEELAEEERRRLEAREQLRREMRAAITEESSAK